MKWDITLGLYHTFEGGCVATTGDCHQDGDMVCDTPPAAQANYTCAINTNSCSELPAANDDVKNYMDYGDNNCSDHFSAEQKQRMIYMLSTFRSSLYTTTI